MQTFNAFSAFENEIREHNIDVDLDVSVWFAVCGFAWIG